MLALFEIGSNFPFVTGKCEKELFDAARDLGYTHVILREKDVAFEAFCVIDVYHNSRRNKASYFVSVEDINKNWKFTIDMAAACEFCPVLVSQLMEW